MARALVAATGCDNVRVMWRNEPAGPMLSADPLRLRGRLPMKPGAQVQVECVGTGVAPALHVAPPGVAKAGSLAHGPVEVRREPGDRFRIVVHVVHTSVAGRA